MDSFKMTVDSMLTEEQRRSLGVIRDALLEDTTTLDHKNIEDTQDVYRD
jgi:hypothetical protein